MKDDRYLVPFVEDEFGGHDVAFDPAFQRSDQIEEPSRRGKPNAEIRPRRLRDLTRIVEGRTALHAEWDRSSNAADDPNDLMILRLLSLGALMNRHEIDDLADSIGREEAGHQDVRVGQIHLAAACLLGDGGD